MPKATIFRTNRSQAVRLPADVRFPDHVKQVEVRKVGSARLLTPVGSNWQAFFAGQPLDPDFPDDIPDQPPEPVNPL